MQFTYHFVALLSTLLPVVNANFDIYAVRQVTFSPTTPITLTGFSFFGNDLSRDNVGKAKFYRALSDVSGSKTGVRCGGSGCGLDGEPGNVDVMEMNFGNNWHFSE